MSHHLISKTLSTQFLGKIIQTNPKPFSFPIQNSLYYSAYPLTILTDVSLNLVSCTQQMFTTTYPDLTLRVLTFTLPTRISTNSFPGWYSRWMTVWLGMHLTLVLPCAATSLYTFCHFINLNVAKFYDWMPFLTSTQYGDGDPYFHQDTISRWLPKKAEEWFTCQWGGDYIRQESNWNFTKSPEISNSNTFIKFPRRHFCVQNCNLTPPLIFVKTLRNIVVDWFLGKKLIECED